MVIVRSHKRDTNDAYSEASATSAASKKHSKFRRVISRFKFRDPPTHDRRAGEQLQGEAKAVRITAAKREPGWSWKGCLRRVEGMGPKRSQGTPGYDVEV